MDNRMENGERDGERRMENRGWKMKDENGGWTMKGGGRRMEDRE